MFDYRRGFLYLVAVMDWASRHVLAWRLSNTLDADFCVEALDEALPQGHTRHSMGKPQPRPTAATRLYQPCESSETKTYATSDQL